MTTHTRILICSLIALASLAATDGTTSIVTASSSGLQVGMNLYLPPGYDLPENSGKHYPLWVFLAGAGERGDPDVESTILSRSTHWGPARETRYGHRDYDCIVVTPVSERYFAAIPDRLHAMVEYLEDNFRVDADRICFSGLCTGAGGVLEYAQLYPNQLAAILPVISESEPWNARRVVGIPTWLFHGFGDPRVPRRLTITWANAITNASVPTPDCMDNYPFGNAAGGTPTANASDQTGVFKPEIGWVWLSGVQPPVDSLLHFTMYTSNLHEIWQETINNRTVLHWLFKQRLQAPFAGTPCILPGRVQAEDFDFGGHARAYADLTVGNSGGDLHRLIANPIDGLVDDEQVDLASAGSGVVLTGIETGEWCEFTATCVAAGTYDLLLRVSAAEPGGSMHVTANGTPITDTIPIPQTDGFATLTFPGVSLQSGPQLLRLVIESGGFDLDWFAIGTWTEPDGLVITPASGSMHGGTNAIITGTNLAGATATFDGLSALVIMSTAEELQIVTPAHAAGAVQVAVTTGSGTSAGVIGFIFLDEDPIITSLEPASGPTIGDTLVTINGENLAGASVTFDGVSASVFSAASSQVVVNTPAHASGMVDVVVTTSEGSATLHSAFAYISTAPTISSIVPSSGPPVGGTTVTITGTRLDGAAVLFDGIASTIVTNSDTRVVVISPAHALGTVAIVVNTDDGSATDLNGFRYTTSSGGSSGGGNGAKDGGSCGLGSGITALMLVSGFLMLKRMRLVNR